MLFIVYLFTVIAFGATPFNTQTEDQKPYVGQLYFPPLGIVVTNDAQLKQAYHEQSGRILSRVTLDEKLSLLTACSLKNYSVPMKDYIAAVEAIKRAHVNVCADYVSYIEIPIEGTKKLEFQGPLQPDKKALLKKLVGRNFNEIGYRLLYQTTVKECNHEQSLLVKPLLTPDEFKKAMQLKIQDSGTGLYHYIELPDRYAAPHVSHIQEQLTPHINAVTTQQKIAVLHLCNMVARKTLTPIVSKYKDLIPTEGDTKSFVDPSITVPVGDRTFLVVLGYDELYENTKQAAEQSGTDEQKALFNFQATPEELGILFQE